MIDKAGKRDERKSMPTKKSSLMHTESNESALGSSIGSSEEDGNFVTS
jgi:hypothetical protein